MEEGCVREMAVQNWRGSVTKNGGNKRDELKCAMIDMMHSSNHQISTGACPFLKRSAFSAVSIIFRLSRSQKSVCI